MRGTGDAYALRKAYHDEKMNDQFRPLGADGAAMFEAAEQARVEAIGALAMKGVAPNLAAQLEQRLIAQGPGQGAQPRGSAAGRCAGPDGAREADRRKAARLR